MQLAIQKAASSTRKTAVAVRSAIRHFLVGLHSLVAAIAAGISVALSIIIVISLVAFVSGSAYGIFFAANAPNADTITVQQAVETLTAEYRDRLEEISNTVQHDRQDITANDDVYYIRWQDVLAVFSSYVSGNEQGAPVAALTEEQVDKLRETMWAMNAVDYSTHPESITIDTTDEDGNPTGIDVELATEAFARMGYRVEIVQIDWEKKKELVESGAIDCIMGCFSMEGRLDDYQWAGPYIASRQVVAVNESSDIYTLQDLAGKNLAVQSTTKPESIFLKRTDERIPKLGNLISLGHRELIFTFLEKGYADAVGAHEESVVQYMKDYDAKFRILEDPLMTVGIGVAFANNDDRGLCQELDRTLEEMRQDGTSLKIIGKYLDEPEKYLEVDTLEKDN